MFPALALALLTADLSGIWLGKMPGRNGEFVDVAFKFEQKESTLTGKIYGDYRSTPIAEGKVTGDEIEFFVLASEQAGNQINDTRIRYAGAIRNGEIELSRERVTSTNAGNGGLVALKSENKTTFKLKRLL